MFTTKINANCTTIRETTDFLLEQIGKSYWLTNRSDYDATEDGDREKQFNEYNDGFGFEGAVYDLAENTTDQEFNARCLMYFGFSPYEARGIYSARRVA